MAELVTGSVGGNPPTLLWAKLVDGSGLIFGYYGDDILDGDGFGDGYGDGEGYGHDHGYGNGGGSGHGWGDGYGNGHGGRG